jgi:hypothetical protein
MSDIIVLKLTGENKLTVIDRVRGSVELVDPAELGLKDDDVLTGTAGVESAFVFGADLDIASRHRTQAA